MRHRSIRGFTLVELMVTVAILGILIALSTAALQGLRPRAELATAASEISTAFKAARHHSMASNSEVWFGLRVPAGASAGVLPMEYMVVQDPDFAFDPTTLANRWPAPTVDLSGARVIRQGSFAETIVPVRPDETGGWGETPALFQPELGDFSDGSTFCDFPAGTHFVGWVVATPKGEIRVLRTGTAPNIEALILGSVSRDASAAEAPVMIVFTNPFGISDTFRLDP